MRSFSTVSLLIMMLVSGYATAASQVGTKQEAVAMVHEIQEMFKTEGQEATFRAISDQSFKKFHDQGLYAFVYDFSGECVAHGGFPELIGKNLLDVKDMNGVFKTREMIKIAQEPGYGWVDYKWPDPVTKKIEDKSSYIEKLSDKYLVGVGVYQQ